MLACLPASSGDPAFHLLSRTQMNTGLQKWETTKKMRSSSYPTPAQLDAYAKKIANAPLTIQIFPNSVKVPQRKHVRRTVNGLDTSWSATRLSPYPSQVSGRAGLLAVLRAPPKGPRDPDSSGAGLGSGGRSSRLLLLQKPPSAAMNPHSGPYATQSTLNLPQPGPGAGLPGPSLPQALGPAHSKQLMAHHPQTLQQHNLGHPMTLQQAQAMPHPQHPGQQQQQQQQQQRMARSQALQQQQQQQSQLAAQQAHSQALQRQHSMPHPHPHPHPQALQQQGLGGGPPGLPPQHRPPHPAAHHHHPQALLQPPGLTQDLRHAPDGMPLSSGLQHSLGGGPPPPGPQAGGPGPGPPDGNSANGLQPPVVFGPHRKPPDADAPPNITVSTSTIPLSMAGGLHQNRPGDLSSIVNQINQFCQARAGMGATSVCEGQIANPSPISRNLLINASSRVSGHAHGQPGPASACLMAGPPDKAPGGSASSAAGGGAMHPQASMAAMSSMAAYHAESEKLQLQHMQHALEQQKQQQQHAARQQAHQHPQHSHPHPAQQPHPQAHQHPHPHPHQQPLQHPSQQQQQNHHQHPLHAQQHPSQAQQMAHMQQQQQRWAQHQLAHMQQPHEGVHPCKNPRMEAPSEPGFPGPRHLPGGGGGGGGGYPHKLPGAGQSFPLKHPPENPQASSPGLAGVGGPAAPVRYANGHYMQTPWTGIPAAGPGPQELPGPYQGLPPGATAADCHQGGKYRPGKAGPGGPAKMMQGMDFMGGDLGMGGYHEPGLELVEKMQRQSAAPLAPPPPHGQAQEPSNGRGVHERHAGYR